MLLLPLAAAGQTTVGDDATAQYLLSQPSAQLAPAGICWR
jgi:hypothetical protein